MHVGELFDGDDGLCFEAGATILREGEPGTVMYFIRSGSVDVLAHGIHIATLGAGGTLGELAFIDGSPRSATVVARSDCVLVPISPVLFSWLMEHSPYFTGQLMRMLAGRLRAAHDSLVAATLREETHDHDRAHADRPLGDQSEPGDDHAAAGRRLRPR